MSTPFASMPGYHVLLPGMIDESAMYDRGYRYEDLVRAVDVVVTKPGYGIISECIANDTALLYTSRGDFREYPGAGRRDAEVSCGARSSITPTCSPGNWQAASRRPARAARSAESTRPPTAPKSRLISCWTSSDDRANRNA